MSINSRIDLIEYALNSNNVFIYNKYFNTYMNLMKKAYDRNWNKKTAGVYVERHHFLPKSLFTEHTKNRENIVCLTAREHFVAHLLLTKCTTTHFMHKMVLAVQKILNGNAHIYVKSSHIYEQLKIKIAKACSERSLLHWSKLSKEERSATRSKGENHWVTRNKNTPIMKEIGKKISATKKSNGCAAGENNAMFGRTHTDASKLLMSTKMKLKAIRNKEKKAYHSLTENKFAYFNLGEQPDGWILGRGKIIRKQNVN